ncbi:MAG: hypothetical protein AAGF88_10235 [Pseudomonadota bacterium]
MSKHLILLDAGRRRVVACVAKCAAALSRFCAGQASSISAWNYKLIIRDTYRRSSAAFERQQSSVPTYSFPLVISGISKLSRAEPNAACDPANMPFTATPPHNVKDVKVCVA